MQTFDTERPDIRTIGVTGTHGKGAVAGMLAWILECAGWQPGFRVGGVLDNFGSSSRAPSGRWMVVEVDEQDRSQLREPTDYFVCNFLEFERGGGEPDPLAEAIADIIASLAKNERLKEAFINLDCDGNRRLCERIGLRPTGYAVEHRAEFHAHVHGEADSPIEFQAYHRNEALGEFELGLSGRYNVVNALGALAVARRLGVEREAIVQGLATYAGMQSRLKGASGGGVTIVKERPRAAEEVGRLVDAQRDRVDKGRVWGVLEAHPDVVDASEPKAWARAASGLEDVLVTAGSARDQGRAQAFAATLREAGVEARHLGDETQLHQALLERVEAGDSVIFLGAEQLFRLADRFLAEVTSRAQTSEPRAAQPKVSGPFEVSNDDDESR